MSRKFKWLHDDLKARRGLNFQHGNSTVPACRIIEAQHMEMPMPVATLWYRHGRKDHIEILNCFTVDYCRRCGVMSYLLEQLMLAFPKTVIVTTGKANHLSKPWLISRGFRQTKAGDWEKRIAKK